MVFPVKRLVDLGFEVLATDGTAEMLDRNGVRATVVPKFSEGLAGNAVERILAGEIALVINTPFSTSGNTSPRVDGYEIRSACVAHEVPCVTTVQGASAAVQGIEAVLRGDLDVRPLQEWNAELDELRAAEAAARAEAR
jgi:carbamoyl-phosphate synthase large subunit